MRLRRVTRWAIGGWFCGLWRGSQLCDVVVVVAAFPDSSVPTTHRSNKSSLSTISPPSVQPPKNSYSLLGLEAYRNTSYEHTPRPTQTGDIPCLVLRSSCRRRFTKSGTRWVSSGFNLVVVNCIVLVAATSGKDSPELGRECQM